MATSTTQTSIQKIPFCKLLPIDDNIRQVRDEEADSDLALDDAPPLEDAGKALPANLPAKTRSMAANIYHHGLLQPLGVYPCEEKEGYYRDYFGGRRYDAIAALVKARLFKRTWDVDCRVSTRKAALGEALSENILRQAMHPLDECNAFRQLIETEGRPIEEVASQYGATVRAIERRLRLARLHPEIAQAFRSKDLTLEQAQAFACTEDQAIQLQVWQRVQASPWGGSAANIRREILDEGVRSDHRFALFVGRDSYKAAGGHIEPALFAEIETWRDKALLIQLVTDKLQATAEDLVKSGAYQDVRLIGSLGAWPSHLDTDGLRPLPTETLPLSEEDRARQTELMQRLEALSGLDALTDEQYEEYEKIQTDLEQLKDKTVGYSATVQAEAIAFLGLDDDGHPQIYHSLYRSIVSDTQGPDDTASHSALPGSEATPGAPSSEEQPKRSKSYPHSLVCELADHRRTILGAGLSQSPELAYDCVVFILACKLLGQSTYAPFTNLGFELKANQPERASHSKPSGPTPASEVLETRLARLDLQWMKRKTIEPSFEEFRALPAPAKADILAYCIAILCKPSVNFDTSKDRGLRCQFHEMLGFLMGLDIRDWWTPTTAEYWGRLNKKQILSALDDIGATTLKAGYADQKKLALADSMERLFKGEGHVSPEINDRARAWAPSLLRFAAELATHEVLADENQGTPTEIDALAETDKVTPPQAEGTAANPAAGADTHTSPGPERLDDAA